MAETPWLEITYMFSHVKREMIQYPLFPLQNAIGEEGLTKVMVSSSLIIFFLFHVKYLPCMISGKPFWDSTPPKFSRYIFKVLSCIKIIYSI